MDEPQEHFGRGGGPLISRRRFLTASTAAAGLALSSSAGRLVEAAADIEPSTARGVGEIEHIVILMQENRSFDHYFGTLSGVRGFSDRQVSHRRSEASGTRSSTSSATRPARASTQPATCNRSTWSATRRSRTGRPPTTSPTRGVPST